MTLTEKLRQVRKDIDVVQRDLAEAKAELHSRLDKPRSGQKPGKSWLIARDAYNQEHSELVLELQELLAKQAEIKDQIDEHGLPTTTLSRIISELVTIEYILDEGDIEDALPKLTALIDNLETDEAKQ